MCISKEKYMQNIVKCMCLVCVCNNQKIDFNGTFQTVIYWLALFAFSLYSDRISISYSVYAVMIY